MFTRGGKVPILVYLTRERFKILAAIKKTKYPHLRNRGWRKAFGTMAFDLFIERETSKPAKVREAHPGAPAHD